MRHRPGSRARALASAAALIASLGTGAASADRATAVAQPQVETVLAGGVGDGGPAASALVNAAGMYRAGPTELWFFDSAASSWRSIDAVSGVIRRVTTPRAAFPAAALGTYKVEQAYITATGASYIAAAGNRHRWVTVALSGAARVRGEEFNSYRDFRAIRPDGAAVVSRSSGDTVNPGSTELWGDGGVTQLLPHTAYLAAAAADGTVFAASSLPDGRRVIERVGPDGTVDVVAGPGPEGSVVGWEDGLAATQARVQPDRLTVTAAGDRVVYSEGGVVRTFAIGGSVTTVAGKTGAYNRVGVCREVPYLFAEDAAVLVGCGAIRSYAYDGSQAPRAGTLVAGLNDAPGRVDSPSGTPLAQAFLGRVRDVAVDPRTGRVAMATRHGAYVVQGSGASATLVRVLEAGTDPAIQTDAAVDLSYGPDGTLYLLAATDPTEWDRDGTWRIQAVGPDGEARPVTEQIRFRSPSGSLSEIELNGGHIAAGADGLYYSSSASVWRIPPGSTEGALVAGDGTGPSGFDVPAQTARLGPISWIGVDPTNDDLLIADGTLKRVDDAGTLRAVATLGRDRVGFTPWPTEAYAVTPDGAVYGALADSDSIWHVRPDGSRVVVAGNQPHTTGAVGLPLVDPAFAAAPDGRLAVAGAAEPSAVVALVRPATPAWSGDAPRLTATVTNDGTATPRLTIVAARPDNAVWRFQLRVWSDRAQMTDAGAGYVTTFDLTNSVSSHPGSFAYTEYSPTKGVGSFGGAQPLVPGRRLYVGLYGVRHGDASMAPPAVVASLLVPGPPVKLSAAVAAAVTYGGTVTVTGRLTRPDRTTVGAGEPVALQRESVDGSWKTLATVVTAADGAVRKTVTPTVHTAYRWVHAATGAWGAATSPTVKTQVKPTLTATAPTTARLGTMITVTGLVRPTVAGRAVTLQRYIYESWQKVATGKVSSTGKVSLKTTVRATGIQTYRLYLPPSEDLTAASSPARKVKVTR